ncbi:hypothetical protein A9N02_03840 [Staphylococcus sp. AOAB]|nr:hypothetical protein A9N02_03840 [Staphylococcus sp. AOAB]
MTNKPILEVGCTYKAHLPSLIYIPGKLVLSEQTIVFKSYYTNHNPLNLEINVKQMIRYEVRKGLLGHKLLIYLGHKLLIYYRNEWYKFSHLKANELKELVQQIDDIQVI